MADRSIVTRLRAEVGQYVSAMRQAQKATEDVGGAGEKSSQQATSALSRMVASAQQNREAWTTAGTALAGVGAGMLGVTAAVLKTGIAYNTLQQQSRAALTTLLGSAKAANEQMDKLDAFAKTSPFAKQTFITAQQQMLGFGVEAKKVVPALQAISDTVAAIGGTEQQVSQITYALAQVMGQGKLTGETLSQLGQFGVDAAVLLGKQWHKSGDEIRAMAMRPGGIPVAQVWDPLVKGLEDRFGGASANVKNTMVGATDRIKAAFRDLSSEFATPLVNPHGGGLLVGASNDIADLMRIVEKAPEPVKDLGGALFSVSGAAAAAGGAFLILTPRILATRTAMATLAEQGITLRSVMASIGWARFGAGMALAAQQSGVFGKSIERSHAVTGALLGTMVAPGWGTAFGAIGGGFWDLIDASHHLNDSWEKWTPAAKAARQRLDEMEQANTLLNRGLGLTSQGAANAAASVKSFSDQVKAMTQRLSDRAEMRDFQQSLDDFTKSLHDNGQTLNINTQQGRDNQAALDDIASTALKVAENMKGLNRVKFLQGARRDLIAAATQARMTHSAAQRLADRLIGLNQIHAKPSVDVKGLSAAQAQLDTIARTMNVLSGKHVDTFVTTHHASTFGDLITPHAPKKAAGGQVFGPGGPTDDRIPALLSNREYVMPVASVDHYGLGFMEAVRARKLAAGGPARPVPSSGGGSSTTVHIAGVGVFTVTATDVKNATYIATLSHQSLKEKHADRVSELEAMQRVRDLRRSLTEMTGKKGHRHLALTGLDRKAAKAELQQALDELKAIKTHADATKEAIAKVRDAQKQHAQEAKEAAAQAKQERQDAIASATDSVRGSLDVFSRGNSAAGALSSVTRMENDIHTYGQLLGQLRGKNVSPLLLQQIVDHANGGDFAGAIRLMKSLLANPSTLAQIDTTLSAYATDTTAIGKYVSDPRFSNGKAWGGGGPQLVSSKTYAVNFEFGFDPTQVMATFKREILHMVKAEMAQAGG